MTLTITQNGVTVGVFDGARLVADFERESDAEHYVTTSYALDAVLALHRRVYPFIQSKADRAACAVCRTPYGERVEYPCPTVTACSEARDE